MHGLQNKYLIAGASLSGIAALLHLACIFGGAPWYRFLGAGEQMAQMDLAGHWYPKVITLVIAAVLTVWALYALSGAGVIRKLPFARWVLCAITAVYLLRSIAFIPLQSYIPENSMVFWLVSSAICFVIGAVHALGLRQAWPSL